MNAREFYGSKFQFMEASKALPERFVMSEDYPILNEDESQAFDAQYIYHTAWAARQLRKISPYPHHVDIGSSLYFAGIVSAFIPVVHYDYRPPNLLLEGLTVKAADITALPFPDNSIMSLSCMHVVEHIGLGRYGDVIDPGGDIKAMNELQRVLAVGGRLIFAVPTGPNVIQYNAHRLYKTSDVPTYFDKLDMEVEDVLSGCACFVFRKVKS